MIVPWGRITPDRFERLALEFARSRFPTENWIATPRTRDGNRDAESKIVVDVFREKLEFRHWLEAKFHHQSGTPTRSQLDPTLVSGLIEDVTAILFVTNGQISPSYIRRAERAFPREHKRFVHFANGTDLALWLAENGETSTRYFGAAIDPALVEALSKSVVITSVALLDLKDYRRNLSRTLTHMATDQDYVLHLLVHSPNERSVDLHFSEPLVSIASSIHTIKGIQLRNGTSSHTFRVRAAQVGAFTDCKVILGTGPNSVDRLISKRLTVERNTNIPISFIGQLKIISEIKDVLRVSDRRANAICYLTGQGGVGKTHLLDSVEADLELHRDYLRVTFAGIAGHDSKTLCQLLLYLHFGHAGLALSALDQSVVGSRHEVLFLGTELLKRLQLAIADANEAQALVSDLMSSRDPRVVMAPLVDPQPAATAVVIVVDDVHKLFDEQADFFARLLTDHFNGSHNSFLVLSARGDDFNSKELRETIETRATIVRHLLPPSIEELADSAELILKRPCKQRFSAALQGLSYSTLNVVSLISDLQSKKLNEPELMEVLSGWARSVSSGRDKIILEGFNSCRSLFPVLDVVYAVQTGVPHDALIAAFGAKAANDLARHKVIRLDNESAVLPFHDFHHEIYLSIRKDIYTHEVGTFLSECLSKGVMGPDRVLPTLLRCGPSFQTSFIAEALSYRDSFIALGRFGPALAVARSIVEVLESRTTTVITDDKPLAEAWFKYAECLNHCASGNQAKAYFTKASGRPTENWMHPTGNGIHFEAEAELWNLEFWALQVSKLPTLKTFVDKLRSAMLNDLTLRSEPRFARAYLTSLNRLMVMSLLLDLPCEQLLTENLFAADDLQRLNYRGFALVDFAKGTYQLNANRSLNLLSEGNTIFQRIGTESRRLLTSATEIAFLRCRLHDAPIASLEDASEGLLRESLWPEYLNSRLKLAALLLAQHDHEGASAALEQFYKRRRAVEDERRRQGLVSHLESGIAFLKGDYVTATEWITKQEAHMRSLGNSYTAIPAANRRACQEIGERPTVTWYTSDAKQTSGRFWLEPRVW